MEQIIQFVQDHTSNKHDQELIYQIIKKNEALFQNDELVLIALLVENQPMPESILQYQCLTITIQDLQEPCILYVYNSQNGLQLGDIGEFSHVSILSTQLAIFRDPNLSLTEKLNFITRYYPINSISMVKARLAEQKKNCPYLTQQFYHDLYQVVTVKLQKSSTALVSFMAQHDKAYKSNLSPTHLDHIVADFAEEEEQKIGVAMLPKANIELLPNHAGVLVYYLTHLFGYLLKHVGQRVREVTRREQQAKSFFVTIFIYYQVFTEIIELKQIIADEWLLTLCAAILKKYQDPEYNFGVQEKKYAGLLDIHRRKLDGKISQLLVKYREINKMVQPLIQYNRHVSPHVQAILLSQQIVSGMVNSENVQEFIKHMRFISHKQFGYHIQAYEDGAKGIFSPQQVNVHYQQMFYDYSKFFKVICQQFMHNLFILHDIGHIIQNKIKYKIPVDVQIRIFQKMKSYVDVLLLFSKMDYSGIENAIIKGTPSTLQQIEINPYEQLITDYIGFNPNYVRIKQYVRVEDLNFLGLILSTNLFFDLEQNVKQKCQQIKQGKSNAVTRTLQNILMKNENHIQIMNKLVQYINLAKNINAINVSDTAYLPKIDLQERLFGFFSEYQELYRSYIINNMYLFESSTRRLNCVDLDREQMKSYLKTRRKEQRRPSCQIEPYLIFHNKLCKNEQITSYLEDVKQLYCNIVVFTPINQAGINNIKQILFQIRHYAPLAHMFTEHRFVQQLNNQLNKVSIGIKENNKAYEAYLNTLIQDKKNTLYMTLQQDIEMQFNVFFINNMFIKIKEVLYTYFIIQSDITLMEQVTKHEKLVFGSDKIKQLRDHSENLKDNALHIINRYMMQWLKQHYIGSITSQIHRPLLYICAEKSSLIIRQRQTLILSVQSTSSLLVDDITNQSAQFRRSGSRLNVVDKNSYMSSVIRGNSSGNLVKLQQQRKSQQMLIQEINELLQDGPSDSLDYNTMGKGLDTVAENMGDGQGEEGNQVVKRMKTMSFPFHQLLSSSSESSLQVEQLTAIGPAQNSQSSKLSSQDQSIHLYISNQSQSYNKSQDKTEELNKTLRQQKEESAQTIWEQIQINEGIELTNGMHSMYQLIIFLRQLNIRVNYDNRFLLSVKQILLLAGAKLIDGARYRVDEDVALFARQAEQVYVSLRTCLAQRITILDELISSQILQYVFLLDFLYLEMKLQRLQSAFGWNSQYAITYLRELQLGYQVLLNSLQDAIQNSLQYNKSFVENTLMPWEKVLEQYAPGLVSAHRSLQLPEMRDILSLAITERLKNIYGHYQQIIQVTALMEQFSGSSRIGFLLLCACLTEQSLQETFPLFNMEAAIKLLKSDIEGGQFVKRQLEVKIGQMLFGQVFQAMIALTQAFLSYMARHDVMYISLVKYDPQQQKLKTNPDLDKLPTELVQMIERTVKTALIDNKMFKLMSDPICPFTENAEYDQFILQQVMLKITPQLMILKKQCHIYQNTIKQTYTKIGQIIKESLNFTEPANLLESSVYQLDIDYKLFGGSQYQIQFNFKHFVPDNLKQHYNILLQEEVWFVKTFNRLKQLEINVYNIQQCKKDIDFIQFKDYNDISTAPIEQYKGAIYVDLINKYHTFIKEFRMIMSSQVDLFQINFDDKQANILMLDVLINELTNNETNINILRQLELLGEQIKSITDKPMRVESIEIAKMQNELIQFQKHLQQLQFDFNKDVFRQIATECNNQKAEYKMFINQLYDNNPLLNFYKEVYNYSNIYTTNNMTFNIYYFILKEEKYHQLMDIKQLICLKPEDEISIQDGGFHIKITAQHDDVVYTSFDAFYDYLQDREDVTMKRICNDGDIECLLHFNDFQPAENHWFSLDKEMLTNIMDIAENQIGYSRALSKRLNSLVNKVDNIRRQIHFYGLFDLDIEEHLLKDLHNLIYTYKIILIYVVLFEEIVMDLFQSDISTIYTNYLEVQQYVSKILRIEKKAQKHEIVFRKIDFHNISNKQELFNELETTMLDLFSRLKYQLQEQQFVQLILNQFITVNSFINNQFQRILDFNTDTKIIMQIMEQNQCQLTVYSLIKFILTQLPMYQYYEKQFVSQKFIEDQVEKLMKMYDDQLQEEKQKLIVFNKKYQLLFFKEKRLISTVSLIRYIEQEFIKLLSQCNIQIYSDKIQKVSQYLKQVRKLLREINQLYSVIKPLIKINALFKQDITYFINFLSNFQTLCDDYEDAQKPNCMKFLNTTDMKYETITYVDRFTDLYVLPKNLQLQESKPFIYSIIYNTKIYTMNQIFSYYTLQDDQIQCATRASNVIRLSDDEKNLLTLNLEKLLVDINQNLQYQKMMMQVGFDQKDNARLINREQFVQFHFDFYRINDIIQLFSQFIERFQIDDNIAYDNYSNEINTFTAIIQQLNDKVYQHILDNTEIMVGERKHDKMNIVDKIKYCEKIVNLEHYVSKGKYVKKLIMITQNQLYIPIKKFIYDEGNISGFEDLYGVKTMLYQPFPSKIEEKEFSFIIAKEILRQSIQKTVFKQQINIMKQVMIPGYNSFDFIATKLNIDKYILIKQLTTIDIVEFNNLIHNLFQIFPKTLKELKQIVEMEQLIKITMEQPLQLAIRMIVYLHTRLISAFLYDNLQDEQRIQENRQPNDKYSDFYDNIIEMVTNKQNIPLIYLVHRLQQEYQHLTQNPNLLQQVRGQLGNNLQNVKQSTQLSYLLRESIDQFISNTKLVDRSSHLKKLQMLMAQRDDERGLQYIELLEDIENLLQKNVIMNQIQFLLTLQIPNPYTLSCYEQLQQTDNAKIKLSQSKNRYTVLYDPIFYIQNAMQKIENDNIQPEYSLIEQYLQKYSQLSKAMDQDYQCNTIFFKSAGKIVINNITELYDQKMFQQIQLLSQFITCFTVYGKYNEIVFKQLDELSSQIINHFHIKHNNIKLLNRINYFSRILNKELDIKIFPKEVLKTIKEDMKTDDIHIIKFVYKLLTYYENTKQIQLHAGLDYGLICKLVNYFQNKLQLKRQTYRFDNNTLYLNKGLSLSTNVKKENYIVIEKKESLGNPLNKYLNDQQYAWVVSEHNIIDQLTRNCVLIENVNEYNHKYHNSYPQPRITTRDQLISFLLILQVQLFEQNKMLSDYEIINDILPQLAYDRSLVQLQMSQDIIHYILVFQNNIFNPILEPSQLPSSIIQENLCITYYNYLRIYHNLMNFYYSKDVLFTYVINNTDYRMIQKIKEIHKLKINIQQCDYYNHDSFFNELYHVNSLCSVIIINVDENFNFDVLKIMNLIHMFCSKQLTRVFCIINSNDQILKINYKETAQFYRIMLQHSVLKNRRCLQSISIQIIKDGVFANSYFKILIIQLQQLCQKQQIFQLYMNLLLQAINNRLYHNIYLLPEYKDFSYTMSSILLITQYITTYLATQLYREEKFQFSNTFCQHILIYTHQIPQQVNLDIFHFNDQDRIKSRIFLDLVDTLSHVNKSEILFKYFTMKKDHIFNYMKHIKQKTHNQIQTGLSRNALQSIGSKNVVASSQQQIQYTEEFDFNQQCLRNQMIINNTYGHQISQYCDIISLKDLKNEIDVIKSLINSQIELIYLDLLINSNRFQRQEFAKLKSSILTGQANEKNKHNHIFVIVIQYGEEFIPRPDNILYQFCSKYYYRNKYGSDPFSHFNDQFRKAVYIEQAGFTEQWQMFNKNINFIFTKKVTSQLRSDLENWAGMKTYGNQMASYLHLQEEILKWQKSTGGQFEQLMEKAPSLMFQSSRYMQQRGHQLGRQQKGPSVVAAGPQQDIFDRQSQIQQTQEPYCRVKPGIDPLIDTSLKRIIPKINFDSNFLLDKYANIVGDNINTIQEQLNDCLNYEKYLNTQACNLDTSIQQLEQTNKIFEKTNSQYAIENNDFHDNVISIKKSIADTQQKYESYKKQIELVSQECERSQKLFDVTQSKVTYIENQFRKLTPSIVQIFRHSLNPPELMKRLIDCLCILFNIPLLQIEQQVMQLTIPYIQDDTLKNASLNDLLFIEATKIETPCHFQTSVKQFLSFIQCWKVCNKQNIVEFTFDFHEEQFITDGFQNTQMIPNDFNDSENLTNTNSRINDSKVQSEKHQDLSVGKINFKHSRSQLNLHNPNDSQHSIIQHKPQFTKSQLEDFESKKVKTLQINVKKLQQEKPLFDFCRCRKTACYERMLVELQTILGNQFSKLSIEEWKDALDSYITLPLYKLKFNEPGYDYGQFFIDHELELHKSLLQHGSLLTNLKGYNKLNLTGHQFSAYNFYTYSTLVRRRCVLAAQFWRTVFRQPVIAEEDVENPDLSDDEPLFTDDLNIVSDQKLKSQSTKSGNVLHQNKNQNMFRAVTNIDEKKQILQEHFEAKTIADINGDRIEMREKGGCNALTITFHQPKNSFELVQKQLRNFFFTHLVDYFRPELLTDEHIELISPYLYSPDCNIFTSSQTSVLATSLINWLNIVIALKKESQSLKQTYKYTSGLQDQLQNLQSEVDKTVIKLNDLQDLLQTGQMKVKQRAQAIEGNKLAKHKNIASIQNKKCLLKTNKIELDRVKQWKQELKNKVESIIKDSVMQLAFQTHTNPQQVLKLLQQDFSNYKPQITQFVPKSLLHLIPDMTTPIQTHSTALLEFALQETWVWKVCGIEPKYCWKVGSAILGMKIPVIWDGIRQIEYVWQQLSIFLDDLKEQVQQLKYYTQMSGADVIAELSFAAYRTLRHFFADFEEPALGIVFTSWIEVQEYALQLEDFVMTNKRQAHPSRMLVIVISDNPDFSTQNIPQNIFTFLNGNINQQNEREGSSDTSKTQKQEIIDLQSSWSRFESIGDQVFQEKCRKEAARLISSFWDVLLCQQTFYRKPDQTGAEQILIQARAAFVARQGTAKQVDEELQARSELYKCLYYCYNEYKKAKLQPRWILDPIINQTSDSEETDLEEDLPEIDAIITDKQLLQLFDSVQEQHRRSHRLNTFGVTNIREVVYLTQQELLYDLSDVQWLNYLLDTVYTNKERELLLQIWKKSNSGSNLQVFDWFTNRIKSSNVADPWLQYHVIQAFQAIYLTMEEIEASKPVETPKKGHKAHEIQTPTYIMFLNAIQDNKVQDFIVYLTALSQLMHQQVDSQIIEQQLDYGITSKYLTESHPLHLNWSESLNYPFKLILNESKNMKVIIEGILLYACGLFEGAMQIWGSVGPQYAKREPGYKLPVTSLFPRVYKDFVELPLVYKLTLRETEAPPLNSNGNNGEKGGSDVVQTLSAASKALFAQSRIIAKNKFQSSAMDQHPAYNYSYNVQNANVYIRNGQKWFYEQYLGSLEQLSVCSAPLAQLNHESVEQRPERRFMFKTQLRDQKTGIIVLSVKESTLEPFKLAKLCIETENSVASALLDELMRFSVNDVALLWYQSILLCVVAAAWGTAQSNALIQAVTRRLMLLSLKSQQRQIEKVITDTLQLRAPFIFAFTENAVLAGKYKISAMQISKSLQLSLLYSFSTLVGAQQSISGYFGPARQDQQAKAQLNEQEQQKDNKFSGQAVQLQISGIQFDTTLFPMLGGPSQIPGAFQSNKNDSDSDILNDGTIT